MQAEAYTEMRALEDSHWWYRSLRRAAAREVAKADSILDVGCGTGGMFTYLAGKKAVGMDISELALAYSGKRGLAPLVRGDAENLPFADASFDAVLCLDLLYHARVRDEAACLSECVRVLTPGGLFVLQAPAFDRYFGNHDKTVHGARRYRAERISALARASGLEVVRVGYRNLAALFMAELFRRRNLGIVKSDLTMPPGPLNSLLGWLARSEEWLTSFRPLPVGLSVWCVARKGEG